MYTHEQKRLETRFKAEVFNAIETLGRLELGTNSKYTKHWEDKLREHLSVLKALRIEYRVLEEKMDRTR